MKYVALIALSLVSSSYADELPKNLLLKCEGKATTILSGDGIKPEVHEDSFSITLRLKDGELADTNSIWHTMKTCGMKNVTVHCTGTAIYPSDLDGGSEHREMQAFVARDTGEYNFFMDTKHFSGKNASGRKTSGMNFHRTGICKQASSPIF
jgi:hypothetical protein